MTSSDGWQTFLEPDSLDFGSVGPTGPVGGARRSARGSNGRNHHLIQTIEGEIIPRLVLARRATGNAPVAPSVLGWTPGNELVAELANLVVREDVAAAATRIESLRQTGLTIETLYLELLAPTARYLGELWEADILDFMSVTLGCSRLQQLLQ